MKVRLTLDPDDAIVLESPYDRTFVERFKQALDYGGRQWDPQRKRWIVSALYAEELLTFLQSAGVEIQDDRQPAQALASRPPVPPELQAAFDALFLHWQAPLCVADASYKALALRWHPDKRGNPEDFRRINDAIAIIRSYLDPKEPRDDSDIPF